ncbi:Ger(x)C family spore germination protein [Bacillus sinesaloumensis]|uniref:Ger(x)C family spore germination protein n=1 Tax=Litchfieldia sinesaloumensis TaxID=1926280 RepID=UPI00098830E2|nr:Ger(x)C family spore germination protein [Bacillus sinesaloumensis]
MKKILIGITIVVIAVVTIIYGRVRQEIIDEVNIVAAVGIDRAEGQKVRGTAVIPVFKADKSIENTSFTDESVLAKEIMNVLQKKAADPLVTGGIRVALYEDELAKKGILRYVDALQRDASIGSKLLLAIVEGKTSEVLEKNLGNRGTGEYLSTIIENNMNKRDVPNSDLHIFMFRHYAKGMDPYLPIIKLLDDDKVEIVGIGLFQDGRLVSQIPEPELFFFKSMVQNYGEGSYTLSLKGSDDFASIKRISTKRKVLVEEVDGVPKVNISIKFRGVLSEYSGQRTNPKIISQIINELETTIKEKCEEMLGSFQKMNIDPVGLGYMARHSLRDFDNEQWEVDYPSIKVEVHSKVILTETGIIE